MPVTIGDYVYRQAIAPPDHIGVQWITLIRREVIAVEGEKVVLSESVEDVFPSHTPPALESITWCPSAGSTALETLQGVIARDFSTSPALPEPYQFDDEAGVIEARNQHRAHVYLNKQAGKRAPDLEFDQAFQFHVLDWRYPW
ncbi:MAG: hypothetical protein NXI15_05590 [Gammaproteobacteria bacterium]|nr:hypothetical protein [Gammaproteobacteria bacterium]